MNYLGMKVLENYQNYWIYDSIAKEQNTIVKTKDITIENWNNHYTSIMNILKDGIFTNTIKRYKIRIEFDDNNGCSLTITDYLINLIMWRSIIYTKQAIQPKHIFFNKETKAKDIKNYIDTFIIDPNRLTLSTIELSNIISDTLYYFHDIDHFSSYLCNTLNLEDSVDLMYADKEFYDALHHSYKNYQIDKVKPIIIENTNKSIDCIKNSKSKLGYDHCLANAWRADEGINPKQYGEVTIGIGVKPNGKGDVFPTIVDTSFINGGLNDIVYYFIESSTSRLSQLLKFNNVSKSGALARIMGLNNMDSFLHKNPQYDCHTSNLIPLKVTSDEFLKHLNLRWYKEVPFGQEKNINYKKDKHLIGKTIYLRSPCTCASAARGNGVCYRCYGNLAYSEFDIQNNFGINIGRIASELITSIQTQKQLSAKHILEASVDKIEWTNDFYKFFEMQNIQISLKPNIGKLNDYRLRISRDNVEYDEEETDEDSDERSATMTEDYITEFEIEQKSTGDIFTISTSNDDKLYPTQELLDIMSKKSNIYEDEISIPLSALEDMVLFNIKVQNNELSKILNKLKNLYNKNQNIENRTISDLLQEILETNIEGKMGVSSIHYEVILMNQIRDIDDILINPDWSSYNPPYKIITLDRALINNPSVTISLSYQKITRAFHDPTTFRKTGSSFMDLFFMKNPQSIIRDIDEEKVERKRDRTRFYEPIVGTDDSTRVTMEDNDYYNGNSEIKDFEDS